jgi:hypothetical protein
MKKESALAVLAACCIAIPGVASVVANKAKRADS